MTEKRLHIETLSSEGFGIARDCGKVYFIPFTAPGDQVIAEITKEKPRFSQGKLVTIEFPSPFRTPPQCKHFSYCGGCALQHIRYDTQLEAKQKRIQEAFQRIGKITPPIVRIHPSEKPYHYRSHIRLRLCLTSPISCSYQSHETNEPFTPEQCPIFEPLHPIFPALNKALLHSDYKGISEGSVRIFSIANSLFAAFSFFPKIPDDFDKVADHLLSSGFKGCSAKAPRGFRSFGLPFETITISGLSFFINPYGFLQAHQELAHSLYTHVLENLIGSSVVDLYCGVGILTGLISQKGFRVIGIEENKESIKLAKKSALSNNLSAQFIASTVEKLKTIPECSTLIVNPPREGLSQDVIRKILDSRAQRVIYISCQPETLARDIAILQREYRIESVDAFDLFPQTPHVETVVILKK